MQMKIKFMYENNCLLVIFCGLIESQKLKTQKLKCYVLGLKSQKFPTAENTRYTVGHIIEIELNALFRAIISGIVEPTLAKSLMQNSIFFLSI